MFYSLKYMGLEFNVELEEDAVVVEDADGSSSQRIDFDSIRSVRVARIGSLDVCVLALDAGKERTLGCDEAASRTAFGEMVRALYEKLAPRAVPFLGGSAFLLVLIAVIALVLGALGLALYLGVVDAPVFRTRGLLLAVLGAVGGPIGAWMARPRPVRSEAELNALLPRV